MLIHGSELVAVAQGLVEYWDSRWIFSALRQYLKILSTTLHAQSPCEASGAGGGERGRGRTMTKVFLRFLPYNNRHPPVFTIRRFKMCPPFQNSRRLRTVRGQYRTVKFRSRNVILSSSLFSQRFRQRSAGVHSCGERALRLGARG